MNKTPQIRLLALGLIQNDDRIFVSEGYDPIKQQKFYRALGGGVDFGETSVEALKREFQEEIQAELTHIQYLGCVENCFTFNGKPGHEWIQFYKCDFADPNFYQKEKVEYLDGTSEVISAYWINCDRFLSGELRLVPEACLKFLSE